MPEQNYAERLALDTVIYPVIGSSKATLIHSNYEVSLDDGSKRFIDFAILGASTRLAIEIDGYKYHAEGAIERSSFDDQLSRQNELILQGWKILRFSFDQIHSSPQSCQDQLRRMLISDADLHPNFSNIFEASQLQLEVLSALKESRVKGKTKGLVCLPTGTGKTILSALDAKDFEGRILFVVHNNHILKQAAAAYKKIFPLRSIGFINSEVRTRATDEDIVFANIGSLRELISLKEFEKDAFSYLVLDEFHHGAAASYQNLISYFTPKFTLGLTATPERTDGKSILKLLQNNLIFSIDLSKAIERGFLVPFSYYGLFDNIDYSNIRHNGYRYDVHDLEKALIIPKRNEAIYEIFSEHAQSKPTIAFCVSIDHAEKMAQFFNSKGIKSIAIHSQLTKKEKAARIALFEKKEVQVVCVRDLFNEGVDFPETQVVLFLRPTESKIIFMQQLGRGLRLAINKSNIIVLDFIGNYFGSSELPNLIRKSAGEINLDEKPLKPEYIYDNGCQIFFSKEVIEHLEIADFKVLDKNKIIQRVFSIFEKKKSPLNPLDLYLEFKEEFGSAIRSFGSFIRFCERMNSLEPNMVVIDPLFSSFDPENHIESDDYETFISDRGELIAQVFYKLLEKIELGIETGEKDIADLLHIREIIFGLFDPISSLCLIRNTIESYTSEQTLEAIEPGNNTKELLFFTNLAKNTFIRNSIAITNGLKNDFPYLRNLVNSTLQKNDKTAYINFAFKILEINSLCWLRDLYLLTNPDYLNASRKQMKQHTK